MAIRIPRSLVEFILLGPEDDRRQLQDSPILGDVWIEYARNPGKPLELLITPYKENAAGQVASTIREAMLKGRELGRAKEGSEGKPRVLVDAAATIAYLQGVVAATLTFEEVLRFVVPMTSWWADKRIQEALKDYLEEPRRTKRKTKGPKKKSVMEIELEATRAEAVKWLDEGTEGAIQDLPTRKRYATLAGLILWASEQDFVQADESGPIKVQTRRFLEAVRIEKVVDGLKEVFAAMAPATDPPLVWTVSLNRRVHPAVTRSVPAVKADAARSLFTVECKDIVWAVIDSGIDARHHAFRDRSGEGSRVVKTFDFTRIRDIVSLDNQVDSERRVRRIDRLLASKPALKKSNLDRNDVARRLQELARGAALGRSVDWRLVEDLVELEPFQNPPATNHGTHVAGILGASGDAAREAVKRGKRLDRKAQREEGFPEKPVDATGWSDGMCPDIQLYDFRVLAPKVKDTEFAVIAALQYIRHLNERNSWMTIHGANLSLSIPHDVRNFACGRTPVCNECERLVNSGVVVVAAAGNRGYQNFETSEGQFENYAAFSVTDPGNADGVITVGATHRYWPHTYGVSFFSSRGPTGDGRIKPDLVAPGEKIRAPVLDNAWGDLDGTSMAAPHVSGAAAMLMARYSEMVGQPRRIKEVICRSATDLGREKTFQGHGMLDVLRAFQSV